MEWNQITGQDSLKKLLVESINNHRISHAQLFVGKEGYGTLALALAYAREVFRKENEAAAHKVDTLNHVDLHFSFPTFNDNKNSLSHRHYPLFRDMILSNPYSSFEDWVKILDSENKQLYISADEIDAQNQKFTLKSFEGGHKILIIWRADKMNTVAANKFLKFLEEPPKDTLILLTAESTGQMLDTILSRTQIIEVPRLKDEAITSYLSSKFSLDSTQLGSIAHRAQGDLNEAIQLAQSDDFDTEFQELFIQWVREAFMVFKRPELLANIIKWANTIAGWKKEKQKNFLTYCSEIFRQALLQNYQRPDLVYSQLNLRNFNWDKFTEYIHGANIESILQELTDADYHLERNGNAKIIWTDMGIKLTRYLHRKAG